MKVGDTVRLPCGHDGIVYGIYGNTMAVKGQRKYRCDRCSTRGIGANYSAREPTVFLIEVT